MIDVTSNELKRWLRKQGCSFAPGKGGHLIVRLNEKISVLPMHGNEKELGKGLVERIEVAAMDYPVVLKPDSNRTTLATFPDLPGTHTFGNDRADALAHAEEALVTMLEFLIKTKRVIPTPSATRAKGPRVRVPALSRRRSRCTTRCSRRTSTRPNSAGA